jgi:hypothetical protein
MAFNADDNWEFPAAVVVAAEVAVEIRPNHVAPAEANPRAILQAAVFQPEIRALGALLQPPGVAAAAAAAAAGLPAPQGNLAVQMGGFSLGELIPSVDKLTIGTTCAPDANYCWP